jgi:hypothetical protein
MSGLVPKADVMHVPLMSAKPIDNPPRHSITASARGSRFGGIPSAFVGPSRKSVENPWTGTPKNLTHCDFSDTLFLHTGEVIGSIHIAPTI